MNWGLLAIGVVLSMLILIALAHKWKLPKLPAFAGAIVASIVGMIVFLWIYPQCKSFECLALAICGQIALSLIIALTAMLFRFWRDPERFPPEKEGIVLSGADGEVVYIRTIYEGSTPLITKGDRDYLLDELTGTRLLKSPAQIIGVGMSFLDVHVNRCPIEGIVKFIKPIEGRFLSLGDEEAEFHNARLTTIIENNSFEVAVVQVASRLVRRIETYLTIGEVVSIGQRLGMIKFGSLVVIVLPNREDVNLEIKVGDRVKAGVTVIARYEVDNTGEGY